MPVLQFKGKSFVENHHLTVRYHQLIPSEELSVSSEPSLTDNLIIHGDNLLALKALLPLYGKSVKCIYIDPPYNTGSENWVYNDNVNSPMIREWVEDNRPVDKEDLTRHDKWLCMMMPRLRLLQQLMRDDGVIFISIDDNEVHHLRLLMDEIFGPSNFIAQLVWEKSRKNDAKLFSVGHEYMLVYARSLQLLKDRKTVWREPKPGAKDIWLKYLELREAHGQDDARIEQELSDWFSDLDNRHPAKKLRRYRRVDQYGPWRDRDISWPGGGGPRYDVIHPVTHQPCVVPERGWGFATPEKMQQQIALGLVVFREDHTTPPFRKAHLRPVAEELDDDETEAASDEDIDVGEEIGMQVMPSVIYKQSQVTVKFLRRLMGKKVINNPKDHEVLARIISYVTDSDNGDIVLDSFAGSGTTAHAVLAANTEDGGNRRFILIEMEDYAETLTANRVRRVIQGVPDSDDEAIKKGLDGTFSYFELGNPVDEDGILSGKNLPTYEELARYIFYTATGEEFDPKRVNEQQHFIGESSQFFVYLMYKPDVEYLRAAALTLEDIEAFPDDASKTRLVFAPARYVDRTHLEENNVKFVLLPFEIYQLQTMGS